MEGFLKLSTAVNIAVLMIDSSDHITGKTGLAAGLTIYATKAAGTPAAITPTVAELDATNVKGLYSLALTTTHTNTLGEFQLHITATGADPADYKWQVSTYLPGEAATLQADQAVNVTKVNGTSQTARDLGASVLLSTGTGTGQLDFTSGVVKANQTQVDGVALTGHLSGKVPGDVYSWNGANVTTPNITGAPNVSVSHWLTTAVAQAADGGFIQSLPSVLWQTARAGGSATSIKLHASASAVTDFYKGGWFYLTAGSGIGQIGYCSAYDGTTKVATTSPAWATTPDATTNFVFIPRGQVDLGYWLETAPNALIAGRVDANGQVVGDKTGYALTAAYDPSKTASQAGDAMALTSGERNSTADAFLARSLGTEGYAAKGAVPTVQQAMFMLLQNMQEMSIASTTLTLKKLDGSTTAMTYTLDSGTTPTSRTRAT